MGGAQPLAFTMNENVVLIADVAESRLARRVEHGYLDEYTAALDQVVARVLAAKDVGEALPSGSSATPPTASLNSFVGVRFTTPIGNKPRADCADGPGGGVSVA